MNAFRTVPLPVHGPAHLDTFISVVINAILDLFESLLQVKAQKNSIT